MRFLIAGACRRTSRPRTEIAPESGTCRPSIISIVVVLPAPFGPSRPKISPFRTWNETPPTALTVPYDFRTSSTAMTASASVAPEAAVAVSGDAQSGAVSLPPGGPAPSGGPAPLPPGFGPVLALSSPPQAFCE